MGSVDAAKVKYVFYCLLRKEGSDLTMLPVHALLDWEYTGVLYLFRCSSLRETLSKAHSYLLMHAKQLT